MLDRLEHPLKQPIPMLLTEAGRVIDLILDEYAKHSSPIVATALGRVIEVRLVQKRKHWSPMK